MTTYYVAGDGSGDYNCDGTADQVQINQALAACSSGDTVYLKGPFTYWLSASVYIGNNVELTGDDDAKLKLVSNAGWAQSVGLIMPTGGSCHDVKIHGFEIDGNDSAQAVSNGALYYTMIQLDDSYNIEVYDMYMHDGNNDGVRVIRDGWTEGVGNVSVHDNTFYRCCHDTIYCIYVSGVEIYNNTITNATNDCITINECNHISIHDNVGGPGSSPTGGCGIQIQKTNNSLAMDDIEIYNNTFTGTNLAGILVHGYNSYTVPTGAKDVYIHHNILRNCGYHAGLSSYWGGGIAIEGFNNTIVENNTIDGCYHDGIAMKDIYSTSPSYTYNTIIRNNIITNTRVGRLDSASGYGIRTYASKYTATLQYNDVYGNAAGGYSGLSAGSNDISVNPLYATSSDYHLQSRGGRWSGSAWVNDLVDSPCIDVGYPSSSYSLEPLPNGSRINLGRYGGTSQASKTYYVSTSHSQIQIISNERKQTVGKSQSHAFSAYGDSNTAATSLTNPVCKYRVNGGTSATFEPTISDYDSDFGTFVVSIPSTLAVSVGDCVEVSIIASEGVAHLSILIEPDYVLLAMRPQYAAIMKNSTDQMVVCPLYDADGEKFTGTVSSLAVNFVLNNGSDVALSTTCTYSSSVGGHKLIIPSANITDSGTFKCKITGSNIQTHLINGVVFLPPVTPHILPYSSTELETILENASD